MIPAENPERLFLSEFISQMGQKGYPNPDTNTDDILNERWPRRWEKYVQGKPSMEVTSEERSSNYI